MDETTLRSLLDSALVDEPPIGPVANKVLRAGIKLRRRRVLSAAGSIAVAAAIAVVVPAVTGLLGAPPASTHHPASMLRIGGPPAGRQHPTIRQHPVSVLRINGSANMPPPAESVLRWRALAKDRASIVKITGEARTTCDRSVEGSGFVISPQHVLTNAHVVAGMTNGPYVDYSTSKGLRAKVVLFDWNIDVAILYVPHLNAPPLRFTGPAPRGSDAVVAGYPENGPFRLVPARVGSQWSASSPNIYQTSTVTRSIYAVRAAVAPGNPGGPLLAKNGKVYGVIFMTSTDTGFALTASEVRPDVRRGARATAAVSTRDCPRPG